MSFYETCWDNYTDTCADVILKEFGIYSEVTSCINKSFVQEATSGVDLNKLENTLLDAEALFIKSSNVVVFPSVVINGQFVRGSVN